MQTIGSHMTKERYDQISVKVRILREVYRRIKTKDWRFATVNWAHVQRHPLQDDYDGSDGPVLALVDGVEEFGVTGTGYQNEVAFTMEFSLCPGDKEEPSDMLNLIAADLISHIAGDHTLEEGGKGSGGDKLACGFYPETFEPEIVEGAPAVRGYLTWKLRYRHATHRPFEKR